MRGFHVVAAAALVSGAHAHQNHGHQHAHAHKARHDVPSGTGVSVATDASAACAQECTTYWQYEWEGKTITVDGPTPASTAPALVTMSVPVIPVQVSANSPASSSSVDSCATACYKAYNQCRVASGSNKSLCASQYSSCLGYSPFGADGSLITPTACSSIAPSTSGLVSKASSTSTSPILSTYVPKAPQPTPIVSTIELPGIYTIPAKTVTVTNTTTVCGSTTTSVPPGPAVYGGVVTVVTNATTVVCPYAAQETNNGTVTEVVKTTTYVCPTPGTYTPVPQTTTNVANGTIIVYPVPVVYNPGVYVAPETIVTATKTNFVYYCPLTSAETSSSTPVPAPAPITTEAPVVAPAPAPAPLTTEAPVVAPAPVPAPVTPEVPVVVVPTTPAAPVVPVTTVAPVPEITTPIVPETSTSSPAPVAVATGGLAANGNTWAMTYTPYANSGDCKSRDEVSSDIASIAKKGFAAVRLYSTDCSGLKNIGDACVVNGLKMILGLFIDAKGISGAAEQVKAIASFEHWSSVELVVIGNEAIFNGYCSASQLAAFISKCRAAFKIAGYSGLITTTETMGIWQTNTQVLCAATDITGVNIHPFFNAEVSADKAGEFALESIKTAEALCPGHEVRNLEIGWPSQGRCNGKACPGVAEQKTAITSILELTGSKSVIFSFQNDLWKNPGPWDCERYWGVWDLF